MIGMVITLCREKAPKAMSEGAAEKKIMRMLFPKNYPLSKHGQSVLRISVPFFPSPPGYDVRSVHARHARTRPILLATTGTCTGSAH
ncbi:hypothetical protein ACLOJK_011936 [Asimina triloba]